MGAFLRTEPISGAKDNAETLTSEQLDMVESILEDAYPDGMEDTQINDFF